MCVALVALWMLSLLLERWGTKMSKQSRYVANELYNEPTTSGGASTRDWVASMRGMMLLYADGMNCCTHVQSSTAFERIEDAFENNMAATIDLSEPNAGTWSDIKAKFGL